MGACPTSVGLEISGYPDLSQHWEVQRKIQDSLVMCKDPTLVVYPSHLVSVYREFPIRLQKTPYFRTPSGLLCCFRHGCSE